MARSIGGRDRRTVERDESPQIRREEVARLAYQLFEQRGRAHGHDWEDWLRAEQMVWQRQAATARR